jgi:hypothetical protein
VEQAGKANSAAETNAMGSINPMVAMVGKAGGEEMVGKVELRRTSKFKSIRFPLVLS